ncbi:hypothetical protein [Thiothrix fructosivorans]|uniref:Uncharacterized protein n=1 Tax=Thiothrix fructosivorans TaxID=111770 RepID=A0A8B0SFM8_9GAMM|nr:hypothetical protein [Thiothrix fructosivorans]MBO0615393.1 hypothetical protein [Thiothrix fructosivorans]QTX10166.1 hypothetical protein J1836_016460 [Thiothrix fructosivorans]
MSQQSTNVPHRQPTRHRARRVVQQHQPQPHKQPATKAASGGVDGLTVFLLALIGMLAAWGILS